MKKGDLLVCVCNDINEPAWFGITPEVGHYYICRADHILRQTDVCYVEEIVSGVDPSNGIEWVHAKGWYKVVEDGLNVHALMEETTLITTEN